MDVTDLPSGIDLAELEAVALRVAQEAAAMVRDDRPADLGVAATKSSLVDIVTEMDQRAQDLLRASLAALRPADAFLGEEEGGHAGSSGITWVVDPIDGTVNYLYGIPAYSVSVAAVVGDPRSDGSWHPVAGAVVNPVTGEQFHASLGRGARRHDQTGTTVELAGSSAQDLATALVGTGFGYLAERRRWQAEVLSRVLPGVRDIRRIGSAALDLCHVADGSLDAYYERGLNPWDFAAGWLVVTESGGQVTDGRGGQPTNGMLVAGPPVLHDALASLVDRAAAQVPPERG